MSDTEVGEDVKQADTSTGSRENGHSNKGGDVKPDKEMSERSSKKSKKSRRSSRDRERSRSPSRRRRSSRSRSPDRRRRRDRSASKDRYERRRRSRSRSPRRRRSPSPRYRRGRSRSPPRRRYSPNLTSGGRRLPGPERRDVSVVDALGLNMPFSASKPPPKGCTTDLSQEERDQRTIFIMQLAHTTRPRDLEDFFNAVGTVRDVRIITDSKTRRTKGIAYIEFWEAESVPLAIGLNGQKLCDAPLRIQPTQSERSRAFDGTVGAPMGIGQGLPSLGPSRAGPLKLYVGSLHTSITEEMLSGIFEPFGRVEDMEVVKDSQGASKGYAYVTFKLTEDGKRAMEQLNGFDLAGRPMKVGLVSDQMDGDAIESLERGEMDRPGVDLGTAGRLALMARLAEGTGLALPSQAQQVLSQQQHATIQSSTPSIATQCFMLSNMFDKATASGNWADDIRDDVVEECTRHGGVVHVYVDINSNEGNVYVKCASINAAVNSVNSLHGRWFAGKVITANYVPLPNYHQLFSDALQKTELLAPLHATMPMQSGPADTIY